MILKSRLYRILLKFKALSVIGSLTLFLALFQHCSRVNLTDYQEIKFLSVSDNPYRLTPPTDIPVIRRYIFLVDMSNSMISGPCINDVNAEMNFNSTSTYEIYDPNLATGLATDHRATGVDCKVDPSLPIRRSSIENIAVRLIDGVFFKTHNGADVQGHRFSVLESWLENLVNTSSHQDLLKTKVMIVPMVGGEMGLNLKNNLKSAIDLSEVVTFTDLSNGKARQIIDWLKSEQDRNYLRATSDDIYRYNNTTMGVSIPGEHYKDIYDALRADMIQLNRNGELPYSNFHMIQISDGVMTPLNDQFRSVLEFYAPCTSCSSNRRQCAGLCSDLIHKMETAWGFPETNDIATMDLNLGMIQALPFYFGSGYFKVDFVQVAAQDFAAVHPVGTETYFKQLKPYLDARNSAIQTFPLNGSAPPFKLVGEGKDTVSYKVTNFYLLNTNYRVSSSGNLKVDSDSDGLYDEDEIRLGSNPRLTRTNGFCLDSFAKNEAFSGRCDAMATSMSCDPTLDSDGDSLNECEESLLGTNPFDFDTDGDSIPDSLEWIYGYNAVSSDEGKDSNGDGILNLVAFGAGLGPQDNFNQTPNTHKIFLEVNHQGKEHLNTDNDSTMWVELYQLIFRSAPLANVLSVKNEDQVNLYATRASIDLAAAEKNIIPSDEQLLVGSPKSNKNSVIILARMIDADDPLRIYWRFKNLRIPVTNKISQPEIDLSQLKSIRVMDRGQ